MTATNPNLNPQGEQMADESMIRTLAAQIEAIWPQEKSLLNFYRLPRNARVLDVGVGHRRIQCACRRGVPGSTGAGRGVAGRIGGDARAKSMPRWPRASGSKRAMRSRCRSPITAFDLVANRHMVQAVPHVERILAELVRVTKPGGHVHVLAEDYTMLHMMSGPLDPDVFWRKGPVEFSERTGTDSRIGRRAWTLLRAAGLIEVRVDYVVVDTLRVPRRVFANIITAWRDGYVDALSTPELARRGGPPALQRNHRFNPESGALRRLACANCFRSETHET